MKNIVIGVLALIIVLGGAYVFLNKPATGPEVVNNGGGGTNTEVPATSTQVKIALLDTTGSGSGKSRGCDNVVMATRTVPATSAPLTAALKALFAEPEGTQPSTAYNFIARTKSTLKFDHATVVDGTANIYLTGSLSGLAGVCDDPRASIQLEETALQFATVKKVQLYLNGTTTKLMPSGQ
jgi:hypothetical protein